MARCCLQVFVRRWEQEPRERWKITYLGCSFLLPCKSPILCCCTISSNSVIVAAAPNICAPVLNLLTRGRQPESSIEMPVTIAGHGPAPQVPLRVVDCRGGWPMRLRLLAVSEISRNATAASRREVADDRVTTWLSKSCKHIRYASRADSC